MQPDDYVHWLEVLGAAVVGLGAWLWRLARLDQAREDRIKGLEQWRNNRDAETVQVRQALTDLQTGQAVQTAELRNICRSLDELRDDQRNFIAGRVVGGGRWNDPPAGGTP